MTLSHLMKLTMASTITPGDAASVGSYDIGLKAQSFTIPAAADVVISRALTLTSGVGKVFEPDTNVYDGGTAGTDPDGGVVALTKCYGVLIENTHATLEMSVVTANFDGVELSATIPPGGVLLLGPFETPTTIGATTTFTLTGLSGATTCNIVYWGAA